MADEVFTEAQLNKMLDRIRSFSKEESEFEQQEANRLLRLRINNAEELYDLQVKLAQNATTEKLRQEQALNKRLIQMGYDAAAVVEQRTLAERRKAIDEEEKIALKGKSGAEAAAIKNEYNKKRAYQTAFQKEIDKVQAARLKEEEKQNKKKIKDLKNLASSEFSTLGDVLFKNKEEAIQNLMAEKGISRDEAEQAVKGQRMQVVAEQGQKLIEDFAKQLQGRIDEIAQAQSTIDTRLQGLKGQRTFLGSYWKAMSQDIISYVGMSPVVKQADVVNSLKTLVGKGIAFNVEQRAFLDTVSAKIANTFDATDATLLKLVRIQQADTTAARLGMESALTAFLNNMYQTTEYMTEAASEIRQNLYEASALMGAKDATAFEYQVQKWMGSLYSVGFSNTGGLSSALGKLAAGDVSAITEGGYGNLLVMAANRANLSIAEILAEGLDDSETNQLMRAMVGYLGDIYKETKNSKIVAQQFANVYGLTASDLKAAANLASSVNNISTTNLNYSGMITQLQTMAGTMYQRTSSGELMTNLFDNLKYATANTMANSPTLYAIYTIASMLDSTVGGINIPAFSVMGNMVDLETTVANLMRVGALSAGILGGIGNMMAGLGNGIGSGAMLKNFGITSGLNTVTRGNGSGLLTTSLQGTSESGYVGNSEGSDVQSKTMGDAQSEANDQLAEAVDDSNETKLSEVDAHIVDIINILTDVVSGGESFHVKFDSSYVFPGGYGGLGN